MVNVTLASVPGPSAWKMLELGLSTSLPVVTVITYLHCPAGGMGVDGGIGVDGGQGVDGNRLIAV